MKKFVKVTLLTALICFVLGVVICIVVGLNKGFEFIHNADNWWDGRKPEVSATKDFDEVYSEEITALDVDFDFGELIIKSGDEFRVQGFEIVEDTKAFVENGTLKIDQTVDNGWINWGSSNLNDDQRLEITVPEDAYLDYFRLNTGLSEAEISGIKTKNAKFTFGAGNTKLKKVSADKVVIDGGVGNTDCEDVEFNDITMDVGVGNMTIEGVVTGVCDIDTGVGDFDMEIDGNSDDYYFDVDAGVGDITIDGNNVTGKFGKRSAKNTIEIDAGVGDIDISFN